MSTGNMKQTYVCVECRLVVRRGFLAGAPTCPKCNRTPQCVVALPDAPLYGFVISEGTRNEFKASAITTLLCSPGFYAKGGGRVVRYPRWPGSKKMMQVRLIAERYAEVPRGT